MSILKKIWTELTRVRSIEFVAYETEEEENARLSSELKSRINEIKKANKDYAMQKLIAWVVHQTLERDNILISDKNAEPEAIRLFEEAKKYGRIDELNRVVGA